MPARTTRKTCRVAILAPFACAATLAVASTATPADAQSWPSQVNAIYKINFGGVELGKFEFSSRVTESSYALTGNAQVSALFGAYEWKGQTRSAGAASASGPKPTSYSFNFNSQSKTGTVQMTFSDNVVTKVLADPPAKSAPGTIPLTDQHMKDVLDPLSAIMALTRSTTGRVTSVNPCGRRIAVFDGKQRFDLILGFKRQANLSEVGGSAPKSAIVCRVKYLPIAGFRMNDDMRQMTQQTGMEVWLVPVPEANVFVPYHIVIPTVAGDATMTAYKVNIDTSRGRVALSH